MKRVISLLLCVALLCSMVVVAAHADAAPAADFADAVGIPGGTVTIDMNIANNTAGLVGLTVTISDDDGLGATFEGANASTILNLTANDAGGIYGWDGISENDTATTFGTLTITIPEEAELGEYTFTVEAEGVHCVAPGNNPGVAIASDTFTITVTDKAITGVNVAIDAGLAIGIHVATTNPADTSITAVTLEEITYEVPDIDEETGDPKVDEKTEEPLVKSVKGKCFTTITDYVSDGEGGYIYYLKVNPWEMDVNFLVDFTENFTFAEEDDDKLDMSALPATKKTVGILSYCNKLLGAYDEKDGYSCADELAQLIADMLEFGRQAQIYKNGVATLALPEHLAATEAAWEVVDPEGDGEAMIPSTFGAYCSENYATKPADQNATAKKKFEFDKATIEFGSKFVVTFTFKNGKTVTNSTLARVKANGQTYSLDGWDLEYAFSPDEYAGVMFELYAAANTNNTNFAWSNRYGPAQYAAYLHDTYCILDPDEEDPDAAAEAAAVAADVTKILDILEAFHLYGASVEAYVASLSE